jgi:hypothetical protein
MGGVRYASGVSVVGRVAGDGSEQDLSVTWDLIELQYPFGAVNPVDIVHLDDWKQSKASCYAKDLLCSWII